MDEESAITVALPFLLRGRWRNAAIVLHCACMDVWESTSSCHRNIHVTKTVLYFSPSLVCVLW